MGLNITCDTDIGEIISVDDVESYLAAMESDISSYKNSVSNNLKLEVESGGLSTLGLNIDDQPILEEAASDVVSNITCDTDFSSFKEEVITLCDNQRQKELSILRGKIDEKINSLSLDYNNCSSEYSTMILTSGVTSQQINSYITAMNRISKEIEFYKNKRSIVEGMLG